MLATLPKVIPINELKNTAQISQTCKESEVPIIITKNGYGEMVLMSIELYDRVFAEQKAATLINEALAQVQAGAQPIDGNKFFANMKVKYGK